MTFPDPTVRYGPLLDVGPLLAAVVRADVGFRWHLDGAGRALEQAFSRARRAGVIRAHLADNIAVQVLRLHPAEVYGDLWWDAVDRPMEIAS